MKSLILLSLLFCQIVLILPPDRACGDVSSDLTLNERAQGGVKFADSSGEEYSLRVSVASPKVEPNPQNSSIIITFLIDSETSVQLGLYNIIGQQVGRWDAGSFQAGTHRIVITNLQLSSGVYFLSFQTISRRVMRKVLYVR